MLKFYAITISVIADRMTSLVGYLDNLPAVDPGSRPVVAVRFAADSHLAAALIVSALIVADSRLVVAVRFAAPDSAA